MPIQLFFAVLLETILVSASIKVFGVPSGYIDWPVFLSPILTFFVAMMAYSDYIKWYLFYPNLKEEKRAGTIVVVCIGYVAVTLVFCFFLTSFHGWMSHLGILILLFAVFLSWDLVMLSLVVSAAHRTQIQAGNRLVNRPTVVAASVAFLFLLLSPSSGEAAKDKFSAPASAASAGTAKEYAGASDQTTTKEEVLRGRVRTEQDVFVAGLVCFHLVFSACGYFITLLSAATEGYDLRLMSVAAINDLVDDGRNLVIVGRVGTGLHIRIFDASGKKVVDKAENELVSGETLTALRTKLNPFASTASLSQEDKQEIIRSATSSAGHTPTEDSGGACKLLRKLFTDVPGPPTT